MTLSEQALGVAVAEVSQVPVDRGVAVLLTDDEGGEALPVALFRLSPVEPGGEQTWYAVGHLDPVSGAPVMARGLVGSVERDDDVIPTIASPLLKQRYDLRSGRCLDDETLRLPAYDVTVEDGRVFLAVPVGPS